MSLPLHELVHTDPTNSIVRLTENGLEFFPVARPEVEVKTSLIPQRHLEAGEQYRFHFDMTICIGCRSCEVACNEQNNTPADLRWQGIPAVCRACGRVLVVMRVVARSWIGSWIAPGGRAIGAVPT